MYLPYFDTEQWMTDHEGGALYNLTDTCIRPFSLGELLEMDKEGISKDVVLDYGSITGDVRLKKELLSLYTTGSEENITTASGCNQANEMVMLALLENGDRLITYTPGYQSYIDLPKSVGCDVVTLPLYEDNGWQPSLTDLRKAFEQPVKMVILNMPSNPTGVVFNEEYLNELIALCRKENTWILADEVYRDIRQPSLSDLYEKGIATASLSKLFSLAGLRFGWIKGPKEVIDTINCRRDYSIISTGPLVDTLALVALRNKEAILNRSYQRIETSKTIIHEWLKEEKRCTWVEPAGGTVSFLGYHKKTSSAALCEGLQKRYGVFFVPGSAFGYEYHVRLSLTAEADRLKEGLRLFSRYLDEID